MKRKYSCVCYQNVNCSSEVGMPDEFAVNADLGFKNTGTTLLNDLIIFYLQFSSHLRAAS